MNGQQQGPPRRSRAGGVIFLIVAVVLILAWIGAHASHSATITSCTQGVTWSCTQTTVPVQTQAP